MFEEIYREDEEYKVPRMSCCHCFANTHVIRPISRTPIACFSKPLEGEIDVSARC